MSGVGLYPLLMRNAVVRVLVVALIFVSVESVAGPAVSIDKNEVDAACAQSSFMLEQFETSQASFSEASAEYVAASAELEEVAYRQLGLRAEFDTHQEDMAAKQDAVRERLVSLYMSGTVVGGDIFLLSDDVEGFLAGQTFLELATDADIASIEEINALTDRSRALRLELEADQESLAELQLEIEGWATQLELTVQLVQQSYLALDAECTTKLEEYQRQVAAEEAARVARSKGAAGGLPPEATPGFLCPLSQPISFINDWGFPRSGGRTHKGTDVFSAHGQPQYAVADGTVSLLNGGLGGIGIWLDSDYETRFYYAHLSAWAPGLVQGQRVTAGQVVGFTGNTGNAKTTPPHLHFGIKVDGSWVKPFPTLARNC